MNHVLICMLLALSCCPTPLQFSCWGLTTRTRGLMVIRGSWYFLHRAAWGASRETHCLTTSTWLKMQASIVERVGLCCPWSIQWIALIIIGNAYVWFVHGLVSYSNNQWQNYAGYSTKTSWNNLVPSMKKIFFFCIRKQKDKNSMSCWRLKQSQLVSCDTSYSTFQVTLNMKFKVSLKNTSWNFNCCCKNATLQQFWLWNFWRKNIIVTWIYLYSIWWNSKPPFSPRFNRQFNFYQLAWHQVLLPCLHGTTKTLNK